MVDLNVQNVANTYARYVKAKKNPPAGLLSPMPAAALEYIAYRRLVFQGLKEHAFQERGNIFIIRIICVFGNMSPTYLFANTEYSGFRDGFHVFFTNNTIIVDAFSARLTAFCDERKPFIRHGINHVCLNPHVSGGEMRGKRFVKCQQMVIFLRLAWRAGTKRYNGTNANTLTELRRDNHCRPFFLHLGFNASHALKVANNDRATFGRKFYQRIDLMFLGIVGFFNLTLQAKNASVSVGAENSDQMVAPSASSDGLLRRIYALCPGGREYNTLRGNQRAVPFGRCFQLPGYTRFETSLKRRPYYDNNQKHQHTADYLYPYRHPTSLRARFLRCPQRSASIAGQITRLYRRAHSLAHRREQAGDNAEYYYRRRSRYSSDRARLNSYHLHVLSAHNTRSPRNSDSVESYFAAVGQRRLTSPHHINRHAPPALLSRAA